MSELKLTGIFAGVAVLLAIIALALAPGRITPEAFVDQGELFFPEFTDPNVATSLEVIDFDEEAGAGRPFKVEFKNGLWTIPSHNDYPADGKDRLAQTAAGVIDIKKDDFRTDLVADHAACGVLDPLDQDVPGLQGRGSRITLKDQGGRTLADFIVGSLVPGREGLRFVRIPGQNRVYAAKMDLDISTNFADWIETSLLEVTADKLARIRLDNYSVNERTLSIEQGELIDLQYKNDIWTTGSLGSASLDTAKARNLSKALEELSIVGVRPKPAGLSDVLKGTGAGQMTQADQLSLQSKGFYIGRQDGRLLSNLGDLQAYTTDGVLYTLRFGEVLYGSGLQVTAGAGAGDESSAEGLGQANRYLFVTAEFIEDLFPEPRKPGSLEFQDKADSLWTDQDRQAKERYDAHLAWERKVQDGRQRAASLNHRFADWYYVISEDSFSKIRLSKADLKRAAG